MTFYIILFGRVWIMGSSFPRIELIRISRITGIVKNRRVIARPTIPQGTLNTPSDVSLGVATNV